MLDFCESYVGKCACPIFWKHCVVMYNYCLGFCIVSRFQLDLIYLYEPGDLLGRTDFCNSHVNGCKDVRKMTYTVLNRQ